MAFATISDANISVLWNTWHMRGFIVLSLLLQVFLILVAPLRAKTTNDRIISLLWLAYFMADWVAPSAIGLIPSKTQLTIYEGETAGETAELYAFWASFLLLHLGGPDTITAFSLGDSARWRQNTSSLIFQVGAAIFIFVQIFSGGKSLVIPTMLVLLAAVIKITEKILALNLSSLPRLKKSMLSKLEFPFDADNNLVEELESLTYSDKEEASLPESIVVKHAYCFFQISKFFIEDLMFTPPECKMSREYFHKVSAVDALRVISAELHFIYEVLHTKALAIRSKWSHIFRFIAFTNVVMALVMFIQFKKHQLPVVDVEITYSLLFGAIVVDVIALFMLVFSDWTIAEIMCYNTGSSKLDSFLHKLIFAMSDLRKPRFNTCEAKPDANIRYVVLHTPLIFRRWSESISTCNLMSKRLKESPRMKYKHPLLIAFSNFCSFPFRMAKMTINSCFHQASETIVGACGQTNTEWMTVNMKYVSKNPFIKELWIFIFEEVRRKSENADDRTDVRKIFEVRGHLFLESRRWGIDFSNLSVDVTEANYNDSIVIWHLATEIWYNKEKPFTERNEEREFSKILSDYMLYLLLNQPNLVPAVALAGIAQMRSAKVLRELQLLINDATKDAEGLCKALLEVPLDLWGGDIQNSPLDKGFLLAKEMETLGEMKWKVMSGVWVEMLSYAATHVKGEAHVQVLSKGGELLAFVWLLMAHFGYFYKPALGMCYKYGNQRLILRQLSYL